LEDLTDALARDAGHARYVVQSLPSRSSQADRNTQLLARLLRGERRFLDTP
jgi:hypothetical protein